MPSSSAPVRTVVFDLGGVLIDWDPRYLYRKIFDDEDRVEWFLSTVCTPDWNEQQDAGRPFAEGIAERTEAYPDYQDEIEAYFARWTEMLGGPIDGTVDLLETLDAQEIPLYALTNWSAETFRHTAAYDFMDRFRGIIVSGREGVKKPDPQIFRLLVARFGLTPAETLFIDDSPRNVAGARAAGLQAVGFDSPDQLRADLAERGLLDGA